MLHGQSIMLQRGAHVCHFYTGFSEQKRLILPFFREGLEKGEHCLYIASDQSPDDWYLEFQAFGVDVASTLESGMLRVVGKTAWRPAEDHFNPIVKAREALGLIDSVLQDFKGIRIAGDATWALEPDLPIDQLSHWEAAANLVYEDQDAQAICQYNLEKQSAPALHTALRTHSHVVIDGRLLENPFYEAPRMLELEPHLYHSDADTAMVEEMLAQLRPEE